MSYETLTNNMLDELEQRQTMCGVRLPQELESKDSIAERYFKKVHEDTKNDCVDIVSSLEIPTDVKYSAVEKIEKL